MLRFKCLIIFSDDRMMKVREHYLKQFAVNVQMQTCVLFFPHTVEYIMVEKPPEEGDEELAEPPPEPVMVEKRVCEVANSCALKYEELIVIEAKEVQLTEETLNEVSENDISKPIDRAYFKMYGIKLYSLYHQ